MATESQILILEVQARLDEAIQKVNSLTQAIDELNQRTGAATLIRIEGGIKRTGEAAKKAAPQVDELRKKQEALARTNKAGAYTLLQFNRVVADAPFGILGIANNIDGLVQAFQELQSSAKAGGSVLGSLRAAITSPAGIALAITIATSLLIKFGDQIEEFLNGTSELDKRIRELADGFSTAFGQEGGKTITELNVLRKTIENTALSTQTRAQAIKDLRELYPTYFKDITDEALLTGKVAGAYANLTNELIKSARARAANKTLEDIQSEKLRLEEDRLQVIAKTEQEIADARRKQSPIKGLGGIGGATDVNQVDEVNAALTRRTEALQKLDARLKVLTNTEKFYESVIQNGADALNNTGQVQEDYRKLLEEIEKERAKSAKDTEKDLEKQAELYAKARQEIEAFDRAFGNVLDLNRSSRQGLSALELLNLELRQLMDMQAAATSPEEWQELAAQIELAEQAIKRFKNGQQELIDQKAKIEEVFGFDAMLNFDSNADEQLKRLAEIDLLTKNITAGFDLLAPAIDQAFNALANGQSVSDALGQALKRLVVQLAVATAKAAILAGVMALIFPGGGIAASAAGFGFKDLIAKFLGFTLPGRAGGGFLKAGQLATVGEAGRELFVPQTSGTIVPNSALGGGQIIPTIEFSYDRLRIGFDRSQRRAGRTL